MLLFVFFCCYVLYIIIIIIWEEVLTSYYDEPVSLFCFVFIIVAFRRDKSSNDRAPPIHIIALPTINFDLRLFDKYFVPG